MGEPDFVSARATPLEIALQNPGGFSEAGADALGAWLRSVVSELAPHGESVAVRFVDDREMRRLNRRFRGRDATTDVLSFPGEESAGRGHVGDIAISVPTARRQSELAGHSVMVELEILLLHGLLHCIGHDHETDDGEMEELERRLRDRWVADDA